MKGLKLDTSQEKLPRNWGGRMKEKRVFTIPELREMGYGKESPRTQEVLERMGETKGEVYFRESLSSYLFKGFHIYGISSQGRVISMVGYFRKIKDGKRYYYHTGYRGWRRS